MLRVVAGEEQADVALFIEGVAPRVAGANLEVMRKPLLQVRFQGVVSRNAHGLEVRSIGAEPDIRRSEVGIAGVKRVPWLNGNGSIVVIRSPPSSGS